MVALFAAGAAGVVILTVYAGPSPPNPDRLPLDFTLTGKLCMQLRGQL